LKETILNPSEHVEEQIETVEQNSFDGLGLAPEVLKAIQDMGFEEPSQIQAAIIPTLMSGSDAIGQAQTGTGKTLAFGAPMISILRKSKRKVSGLVLAPTRELAVQVSDELTRLSSKTNLRILPVFGGAPIDSDESPQGRGRYRSRNSGTGHRSDQPQKTDGRRH